MRALWLSKFDFSGNTEAVMAWARGAMQKGLKVHLVLNGLPPSLLGIYEEFINKSGLPSSLNINRQQVQNLLYYRHFDLLHVFHPDLFGVAAEVAASFRLPWVASVLEGERHANFKFLHAADFITCCHSSSLQAVTSFFYPCTKQNLMLIPQGVAIKPADFLPLTKMGVLYVGPLESSHIAPFQALNRVIQSLKSSTLGVVSRHNPSVSNVAFYPWRPDFSGIAGAYNIVAGFGYFLLQGIAAGKIALILEAKYAGIFSPGERQQVPDLRAKVQAGEDPAGQQLLNRDLQALYGHLPAAKKLQQENWSYARENHDLEIVAEKFARLYSRFSG